MSIFQNKKISTWIYWYMKRSENSQQFWLKIYLDYLGNWTHLILLLVFLLCRSNFHLKIIAIFLFQQCTMLSKIYNKSAISGSHLLISFLQRLSTKVFPKKAKLTILLEILNNHCSIFHNFKKHLGNAWNENLIKTIIAVASIKGNCAFSTCIYTTNFFPSSWYNVFQKKKQPFLNCKKVAAGGSSDFLALKTFQPLWLLPF